VKPFRNNKGQFIKGIHFSPKTEFKKGGVGFIGKHTEETKEKIREARKRQGSNVGMRGRQHTEISKIKMSIAHKGMKKPWVSKIMKEKIGVKHPNWKGGISFEPYGMDWTQTLKRSIRERDKYTCRVCGKQQGNIAFDVHHIDYDKKNCNPDNLITLCHSCHMATNSNREFWKNYLGGILK